MQYMKHRDHGTHIAYSQDEVERNESHGWVCVDHPHDDPFKEVETRLEYMTLDELRAVAKDKGLKVHHAAKKPSILNMIRLLG